MGRLAQFSHSVLRLSLECPLVHIRFHLIPARHRHKEFATRIDGSNAKELGLKGKPEPDYFLCAAEKLGLTPGECLMVEDAISGVTAGKRGNFGLVLGISRNVAPHELIENGADIVVGDLSEISPDEIHKWFENKID